MKPFNLEEALAGKPVVTRDGKPVTQITHFMSLNDNYVVYGVIEDIGVEGFTVNGEVVFNGSKNLRDLMMATTEKSAWVNLYRDKDGLLEIGAPYETEVEADEGALLSRLGKAIKLTWEE